LSAIFALNAEPHSDAAAIFPAAPIHCSNHRQARHDT
jgi:hypothetical protein